MENFGTSPSDNKYIDEITMKLLTNKTNYAKYLCKTDSDKYKEHQQFIKDCKLFHNEIISMTKEMCQGKDNVFGSDVNESFNNYARTLIRYLEVKKKSEELQKEYEEYEENEKINEDDEPFPLQIESDDENKNEDISDKNSYNTGTMDMFVRKR
jgi:hypothetical protein|tara:strand:+ start:150 stop:611 length:462 start_codon:yes stop_codon:yes gene_type:complete